MAVGRVVGGGGRRGLIDQVLVRCVGGLENILTSPTLTKNDKSSALDSHVYGCVNSVLSIVYPLVKKPRYVALAVLMIEDAVAGLTGTPLSTGINDLLHARQRVLDCMKIISASALISRRRSSMAPPTTEAGGLDFDVSEDEEEGLTTTDIAQVESGARDVGSVLGTSIGIQALAARVLRLVEEAETELDIVDADTALATAYSLATRIAVDRSVRRAFAASNMLTSDFDPDPAACLRKTYSEYVRKLESLLSSDSPSASLTGRAYSAYTQCVDFLKKHEASPCRDIPSERDKDVCAKEKCASAVIQVLPSIIERLGVTVLTSPQALY